MSGGELRGFPGVRRHWGLDPHVTQLNHGGFGAVPLWVLAEQRRLRDEMEANPTDFLTRRLPAMLDAAREQVAGFVGTDPAGAVFVLNATAGVQTALAALPLGPGDEVVTTDHCYYAVRVQLERLVNRRGARLVVADLPMPVPVPGDDAVVDAVLDRFTPRTRALVVDHVTSPTAIVMPVARLVAACRARGVLSVVDGAHAPGMLDFAVGELGADFWTGNLHKWVCGPKTSALLWARPEHRDALRPLVASHFYAEGLHEAFDWTGTFDPTPILAAAAALDFFAGLGWDAVRRHNRTLPATGARLVATALGTDVPVPDDMAGSMRVVSLPAPLEPERARDVEQRLLAEHGIEVPLTAIGGVTRWVRLSAQIYNEPSDYERLAEVLPAALAAR